jgi:hypothetical protein
MKADKRTLMVVKQFLKNREGWDLDELKENIVGETGLIRNKEMGDLMTDECGIEWDGKDICMLDDFINKFTDIFIDDVCNVLDSFVDEDISDYHLDEDMN